jgi:hypothetical protein
MRVLVSGSRTWDDAKTIRLALEAVATGAIEAAVPLVTVVHGACPRGADEIADQWVRWYRGKTLVIAERHPALWTKYGKRAGIVRNEIMVSRGADLCLAFIRDDSPGATHCAELASDAGIPLRVWRYGEPGVTSMDSRHLADEDVI